MIPDEEAFRVHYVATGGSPRSASSYLSYLRAADRIMGGINQQLERLGPSGLRDWMDRQPTGIFGSLKDARNIRSAVRRYVRFRSGAAHTFCSSAEAKTAVANACTVAQEPVLDLLREAKDLGARYYRATGKPLGVTGEVAELEAAEKLGLTLCGARTPGFDATDPSRKDRRIQIKGRAVDARDPYRGRCPAIKCGDAFDDVVLVLLDRRTLEAIEIWRATEQAVQERLAAPGSKARNERSSLGISQFRSIATLAWPASARP